MYTRREFRTASASAEMNSSYFSAVSYTGNGASRYIDTGVDISNGGVICVHPRASSESDIYTGPHLWIDSLNGINSILYPSDNTAAQSISNTFLSLQGKTLRIGTHNYVNRNRYKYVLWCFRKALGFFDVVNYTGTGGDMILRHSLGITPGAVMIKRRSSDDNWYMYHKNLGYNYHFSLNRANTDEIYSNDTITYADPSTLHLGTSLTSNGEDYTAYLFAHDPSTNGKIVTGKINAGSRTVSLGWQPRFITMTYDSTWRAFYTYDYARGFDNLTSRKDPVVQFGSQYSLANYHPRAEYTNTNYLNLTETGFELDKTSIYNAYYIAIR